MNINNTTSIYFELNSTNAVVSFGLILASLMSRIYLVMSTYYAPFICFFGILNNLSILIVMIGGGRSFKEQSLKTCRLYYIAIAFADIWAVLSMELINFTGNISLIFKLFYCKII